MLENRFIPQFSDESEDWRRFLDKACKGSIKAIDMLGNADMAYMVDLTGDPSAPGTLELSEYAKLFETSFPRTCPAETTDDLIKIACTVGWFPHAFRIADCEVDRLKYQSLWGNPPVKWSSLASDAVQVCFEEWSAQHCLICLEERSSDYNSLDVVAGMLYLSLTWPEVQSNDD